MAEGGARPLLCTKFAALPWRLGRKAVTDAAKASLQRLGVNHVDSYMVHWPGVWMNEEYAEGAPSLTMGSEAHRQYSWWLSSRGASVAPQPPVGVGRRLAWWSGPIASPTAAPRCGRTWDGKGVPCDLEEGVSVCALVCMVRGAQGWRT